MFINLWRKTHTMVFVDVSLGLSFCVMYDKELKNNVQQSRGMLTEA